MATSPPVVPDAALHSLHTANLPAHFERLHTSLVVSTYQVGQVIVVRNGRGILNTHFRPFAKPMGIAAGHTRLTIGDTHTVCDYRLSCATEIREAQW